ncbi:MAG: helix-turn-helix domain-containing protein [Candidatus Staskawiczbacteria bacterium]|jgi:transposase-like protein
MARFKDKEKALALRKQEMSYSQIKNILGINKSTLSGWLKNFPLTAERIRELSKNERVIEKCRETKRKKKEKRLNEVYLEQKSKLFPFSERDFFIAGLFLYWGEGNKTLSSTIGVSNTEPSVINFFISWVVNYLNIPKEKINIQLHLYNDMDIDKEINFWTNILKIPKNQFSKPYIKKSLSTRINQKGGFGHGTCNARIGNARLNEKILMSIKAISDKYSSMGQ